MADDVSKALGDVVRAKAPRGASRLFDQANDLWRNYKPIQREALSDFDPFSAKAVRLKSGMGAIEQALVGKEPNAVTFLKELERITGTRILRDPKLVKLYRDLSIGQRKEAARLLDQALEREGISFAGRGVAREARRAGVVRAERVEVAGGRMAERARRVGAERVEDIRRRGERAKELFGRRRAEVKADIERRQKILKWFKWSLLAAAGSKYFLVQLGVGSFE